MGTAAREVAARMAAAAVDWLDALDPAQRALATGGAPSPDAGADAERTRLLIEYDNTQRNANHAHSVWRDPAADFGYDVLGAHLAERHR